MINPSNLNWYGGLESFSYYFGYFLVLLLVIGLFVAAFVFMQYRYKVTVFRRGGRGSEEGHFITKVVRDRVKEYKDKHGNVRWKMLFSRATLNPFDYSLIYPGNNLFMYQTGKGHYHPFKAMVSNPSAAFKLIPQDVNMMTGLEMEKAAHELTKPSMWDKYGNTIVMMGTIMFCLILVGVTIYYTYQYAGSGQASMNNLADALQNFGVQQVSGK